MTNSRCIFQRQELKDDSVINRFQGFLEQLDHILKSPREIIESSFSRMGIINDEILEFARSVEMEMLRIAKSPENRIEEGYSVVLDSNEVKMAFNLIMKDFVDRFNHMPEKVKGDIDDTVGKLRNFLRHTLRDLVAKKAGIGVADDRSLYAILFYDNLAGELKNTKELLDLIINIQTRFVKANLTPEIFKKMKGVFKKRKLISSGQWDRVIKILTNTDRFFHLYCLEKKHLMRCTDFFELNKKIRAFSELSKKFIKHHEVLNDQPVVYVDAEFDVLIQMATQFEEILLDMGSFLEFVTYEVRKRECLNYKDAFLLEKARRAG